MFVYENRLNRGILANVQLGFKQLTAEVDHILNQDPAMQSAWDVAC